MAVAYFDSFAGSGGDMIVASLIDAGASLDAVRARIARLHLHGVRLSAEPVRRGGIAGLQFHVHEESAGSGEHHAHRHLADILGLIDGAGLADRVADRARRIFTRLAEAEAKVHGIGVEAVHFHEVGAVDSIVDVVAACVALELLDIDAVSCSPIPVGRGTIECEHGRMPAPSPATSELLVGAATRRCDISAEVTTPTAAAVLTTLTESFGPLPPMQIASIGWGAGTRDSGPLPNLLRVFIGTPGEGAADAVVELSANVDDCTGETIGAAIERLLAAGCLDAWAVPAVMKKSRPAWMLCALCEPGAAGEAERIVFAETTTFGIRRRFCQRTKLLRDHQTVETPYGPIRMKVGRRDGSVVTAAAEFEDSRRAAEAHGVSVREVQAAAATAWRQGPGGGR